MKNPKLFLPAAASFATISAEKMHPWAPEMHSKAQKGFITKAELSCRIEYVQGTSHKAAEYSLFLIVFFFSKASLLSELLGVQSGENANGDLQKCKMCS